MVPGEPQPYDLGSTDQVEVRKASAPEGSAERRYHLRYLDKAKEQPGKLVVEILTAPDSELPRGTRVLLDRTDYELIRDSEAIYPEFDPDLRPEDYMNDVSKGVYFGRVRCYSFELLKQIRESVGNPDIQSGRGSDATDEIRLEGR